MIVVVRVEIDTNDTRDGTDRRICAEVARALRGPFGQTIRAVELIRVGGYEPGRPLPGYEHRNGGPTD